MIDTKHFKTKLEEEKNNLEKDLGGIATTKFNKTGDWEAVSVDKDTAVETRDEVADRFEDLEERQALEKELETRLNNINQALDNIEKGIYGQCKICQEEIESDRLEANPAALTCKAHIDED